MNLSKLKPNSVLEFARGLFRHLSKTTVVLFNSVPSQLRKQRGCQQKRRADRKSCWQNLEVYPSLDFSVPYISNLMDGKMNMHVLLTLKTF